MTTSAPLASSPRDSLLPHWAMLLFGLAWLIPLHFPPWASFYSEYVSFLGLACLLLYCARAPAAAPASAVVVALTALIPLIQHATGIIYFSGDAFMVAAYLMGLALAIYAGFVLAGSSPADVAAAAAWVFVAGGAVSSAFAIHQALGLDAMGLLVEGLSPYDNRPYANLGQPNHLATILCLGLAGLLYLRAKRGIQLAGVIPIGLLLILGVTLTQSRTPWLGAPLLLVWWMVKRKSVPQISGRMLGIGVIVYASIIVLWPEAPASRAGDSISVSVPRQRSDLTEAGTHLLNWQEMSRAVLNQPWTGYGWNQVTVAHVQAAHERHTYAEMLSHSHNLLLDLVVWNGVPIGLLLIVGIGWWLTSRALRCRTAESWFALAGIGLVGVHAMVEYPLDYAYFLLPVGLFAGLVEAEQGLTRTMPVPRAGLWAIIGASALAMVFIGYEYRIIEADYRLMRFETSRIGQIKAAQPAPDVFLLTQLREDIRMARSLAREGMSPEELEWMRKIAYRYPWYSSLFRYSLSLALNGRQQEASVEFRRLYDIYGEKPYAGAKEAVHNLADTKYPQLRDWQLPPP